MEKKKEICILTSTHLKWKFRPRLQQLIGSNSEDAVRSWTSKAFGLMPDVQAAVTELCRLKGVGPATASVAFMADEAAESIAELRPVEYTAKHYALFLQNILNKTSQLNTVDGQQDWTPHRVEQCLLANQKPEKRKTADEEPSKRQKTERS
uniref:Zgc:112496 n=1 Tax=Sinocyclocheilus grahami TaxID=75366 RepID=A0A672K307_SINGR